MATTAEVNKPAGSERLKALLPEILELLRPRRKLLAKPAQAGATVV